MDLGLKDKAVIVLASSAGIGKGVATEFAREGARVMLFSRNEVQLKQSQRDILEATGVEPAYTVGDVTRRDDIRNVVAGTCAKIGPIYALVNNAGGPPAGTFDDFDDGIWQNAFELTLLSYIRSIREVMPMMRQAGKGRIVNLTSSSTRQAIDNLILSNTFRLGVVGLTKTLARELGPQNILINVVGPGKIETERVRQLDTQRAINTGVAVEELKQAAAKEIALGRYGEPIELARLVVFLCSEANTYITGQTVLADGGLVKAY
jgi:3-oxoacyl-[acyl-carrier protein] reductase